jgi:hypothetical protein
MFSYLGNSPICPTNPVFSLLFNECEEAEEAEEAETGAQFFCIGSGRGAGLKPWKQLMGQPH